MGKVSLLDCTLRDGGYLTNWEFGNHDIQYTIDRLVKAKMDIVEVGFIRDEDYIPGRTVFNDLKQLNPYLEKHRKQDCPIFSVMAEQFNPYPTEKLLDKEDTCIDAVRIIIWKRLIPEAVEYAKKFADKGYKVCIQPERVNQYSIDEFKKMIEAFQKIDLFGIYIVDSNGFLCKRELLEYIDAADSVLKSDISLGYHGHNNLLETVGVAESFVEKKLDRNIIIDGSVFGIGRSSGNLPIELIAKYMNDNWKTEYSVLDLVEIYDECIDKHYQNTPWGYSMKTFVTSAIQVNPNYATILSHDYGLKASEILRVVNRMNDTDRVITNRNNLDEYISQAGIKGE